MGISGNNLPASNLNRSPIFLSAQHKETGTQHIFDSLPRLITQRLPRRNRGFHQPRQRGVLHRLRTACDSTRTMTSLMNSPRRVGIEPTGDEMSLLQAGQPDITVPSCFYLQLHITFARFSQIHKNFPPDSEKPRI